LSDSQRNTPVVSQGPIDLDRTPLSGIKADRAATAGPLPVAVDYGKAEGARTGEARFVRDAGRDGSR